MNWRVEPDQTESYLSATRSHPSCSNSVNASMFCLSMRGFAIGYPLRQPLEHVRPRPMDRDEVLDPALSPVDLALVLLDRAQFAAVHENRGVSMSIEPCA